MGYLGEETWGRNHGDRYLRMIAYDGAPMAANLGEDDCKYDYKHNQNTFIKAKLCHYYNIIDAHVCIVAKAQTVLQAPPAPHSDTPEKVW